jgi:hypothetical protein
MEQKLSPDGAVIIDPSLAQILAGTKDPLVKIHESHNNRETFTRWAPDSDLIRKNLHEHE